MTGYYIYLEATGVSQGAIARVVSQEVDPTNPPENCLGFWYHMFGTGVGTLTLYTRVGSVHQAVWSRSGTQGGNQWFQGFVTVAPTTKFNVSLNRYLISLWILSKLLQSSGMETSFGNVSEYFSLK